MLDFENLVEHNYLLTEIVSCQQTLTQVQGVTQVRAISGDIFKQKKA